jgi:hypothetical protein
MTRFIQKGKLEFNEDGSIKRSGLVEAGSDGASSHFVGVFEELIAPDGTRIASRSQMHDYTQRTGMINDLDSLREKAKNQVNRQIQAAGTPQQRKAAIRDAIERTSSSGYHRRVEYYE